MVSPGPFKKKQEAFFQSGRTKAVSYRKQALKKLRKIVIENEDAICDALYADFKKPKFESLATETQLVLAELNYIIKNIELWAKPKVVNSSLSNFPSKDWIQFEPYGRVLIISPWNYPFMLAMSPLIGAVAAGNSVVLKPSELSPNTSSILAKIISQAFDEGHVATVQGGVETSQELLSKRWDYIFFTGSTHVGKIVYKAAAEYLTPVTLELGGKNPCIIDQSAPIKLTAKRIVWGKFINAGQTCLAPDYLLVHEAIKSKLIDALKVQISKAYGDPSSKSEDLARIATSKHYKGLKAMLEKQNILYGGTFDDEEQYISPTLIDEPPLESKIMEGEIFGPILPVYGYKNTEDLDKMIARYGKSLALYVFSTNTKFQKEIFSRYSFGGGAINDTVIQIANKELPFGGLGNSGFGGYHGKYSFELFSHKKSVIKKANWLGLPFRYAPYKLSEAFSKKFKHLI